MSTFFVKNKYLISGFGLFVQNLMHLCCYVY